MRIVGGKFKGRKLADSSKIKDLRPTTDANRESLFNILFSAKFIREIDFDIKDATVADICCGTGAVGFEALSRGAKSVVLVDKSPASLDVAKKNAILLNLENQTKFILSDATKLQKNSEIFDLIYIDPPYDFNALGIIATLIEKNWISIKTLIIVETAKIDFSFEGLDLLDRRRYGITYFSFFSIKKPISQSSS